MKPAENAEGDRAPLIFMVAGEPSGDALGSGIMRALGRLGGGNLRFAGVGGPAMAGEGLESLFPMADLSVMGLAEVVPRIPLLARRLRQTAAAVEAARPALVLTIDSPDFNFRLARRLRGGEAPLVHYVAPTVWAWRPGRARRIAGFLDHLLALLPFEPPYFEAVGLPCTFVGHPVVESGAEHGDGAAFRRRHGIAEDAPLLCLLPGSRGSETSRLLPVFRDTLELLKRDRPGLRAVVATVDTVAEAVAGAISGWPEPPLLVRDEGEKFDAFAAADCALAASGTVALELAMAGTPAVITYRVSPPTAWLLRRLVRVPYANLVNIILDRPAVPELLQEECRADLLSRALEPLFEDGEARRRQLTAASQAMDRLGGDGAPPSERAARVVLDMIWRFSETQDEVEKNDHGN